MSRQSAKSSSTSKAGPSKLIQNDELITRRIKKGWTVNDLAREARIAGNTVLRAQKGLYIDERSQGAMCRALGCEDELLTVFPEWRQKLLNKKRGRS